jgi:hypothetical protein
VSLSADILQKFVQDDGEKQATVKNEQWQHNGNDNATNTKGIGRSHCRHFFAYRMIDVHE